MHDVSAAGPAKVRVARRMYKVIGCYAAVALVLTAIGLWLAGSLMVTSDQQVNASLAGISKASAVKSSTMVMAGLVLLLGALTLSIAFLAISARKRMNQLLNSILDHQVEIQESFDDQLSRGRLEEYLRGILDGNRDFYLVPTQPESHLRLVTSEDRDNEEHHEAG